MRDNSRIYDHAEATKRRLEFHSDLDAEVLASLSTMLDDTSPFVRAYRHMYEIAREHIDLGHALVAMGFAASTNADMRRYNNPMYPRPRD